MEALRDAIRLHQAGRLADAQAAYARVLAVAPRQPAALNNLGILLRDSGRFADAEEVLRRAIAAAPGSVDPLNNLGLTLMQAGRGPEALEAFQAALAIDADSIDVLNNLSVLLKQMGRQRDGEPLLRRALARDPADVGVLVNLGDLLVATDRPEEALPLLEEAVRLAPRSPQAHNNLALALKELHRDAEATPHLAAALAANPTYLPALHNLGNNLVATGRADEGVALFLKVLDREPGNVPALYALSTITDHRLDDALVERIEHQLARPGLAPEPRQLLHMALASARDRRGEHDIAIGHAIRSGALKRAANHRAGNGFVRADYVRRIDGILATFAADRAAGPTGWPTSSGLDTQRPVFVVGMPRSGTTLVEQILASHPRVHGRGETDDVAVVAARLGDLRQATPEAVRSAARDLLATMEQGAGDAARIVDKTTINFLHVGLIHALFPRARFIHTVRDPRDTCTSCLFHNFTGGALHFTNDLGDLGLVHRQKDRLMAHWHATLPGTILDVPYEALVDDLEGWTRRMLDHLGLEWSAACLDFHALDRRVRTASNLQVRKPVYTSSVGRWKRYEPHLGPLLDALAGGDPPAAEPEVVEAPDDAAQREAQACLARGVEAHRAGRREQAVAAFRRLVEIAPMDGRAHMNLGVAIKETGDMAAAEAAYRRAVELSPLAADVHNNLGILLSETDRVDEALAAFDTALRIDPRHTDARHNRGAVLAELHRHEEALPEFHAAIAANPADPEYHNSLGASLAVLGHTADALACYEKALAVDENHAWAHFNRSQAWLLQGDWERGFAEWEWRKRLPKAAQREWDRPAWTGSVMPAGTVLLHCEQGLGDTLQFVRFARTVKDRVGRVVLECQPALVPLLSQCGFLDAVVAKGEPLPPHDAQVALMSLPHVLGLGGERLGQGGPYLAADPGLVARWRDVVAALPGTRKVGIAWQGNPKYKRDRFRSVPLEAFAPLAAVPGVTLVSLQHGSGHAARAPFPLVELGPDVDAAAGAFMDTAAIMANLDLVITSDTSIPHLAGGLGVPTWVALAANPDFRWLDHGDACPWYSRMRLFRQRHGGEWGEVFAALAAALGDSGGPAPCV